MRKLGLSLLFLAFGINTTFAVQIHGKVMTDNGAEIGTGATIRVYDNSNNVIDGTSADTDGKFNLTVPDKAARVEITFIGQTPKTFTPGELNGQTIILETLPETLDEVVATGYYTGGDGCNNEENDRISPELALCSVHAYNIGQGTNPSGEDRQLMRDVIALKSTIISQQMNKQYEYMDSMIRRFKTQLEKAILTTKLQSAGATSASSGADSATGGGYGATGDRARPSGGIGNAEDCISTSVSSADAMQCLMRNIAKIQSAVASGDIGAARRQLSIDRTTLNSYNQMPLTCNNAQQQCSVHVPCENALGENKNCDKAVQSNSTRNDITVCLGQFRACIVANIEALQSKR